MPEIDQYEVPMDLRPAGSALWCGVSAGRSLTAANLTLLHNVCRLADRCDDLTTEIGDRLTTTNHRGDEIINPLISEHRQQLATMNQILSRMGLNELARDKSSKKSVKDQVAEQRAKREASA